VDIHALRLQFKIVHRARTKHANVDALSKNLLGGYEADEDYYNKIQDFNGIVQDDSKPFKMKL